MNNIRNDTISVAELFSATSFCFLAILLSIGNSNSYFWISMLFVCSALQYIGIRFKFELVLLRICMAWVSGVVWTWLSFVTLNNNLHIPALCIGITNMYAFIVLTNRSTIDWRHFFQE